MASNIEERKKKGDNEENTLEEYSVFD